MPTREVLPEFLRDWEQLTPEQQQAFRAALAKFIEDLRTRGGFRPGPGRDGPRRPGLRVKEVRSIAWCLRAHLGLRRPCDVVALALFGRGAQVSACQSLTGERMFV